MVYNNEECKQILKIIKDWNIRKDGDQLVYNDLSQDKSEVRITSITEDGLNTMMWYLIENIRRDEKIGLMSL